MVEKNCENCNSLHDGTFASGRFCKKECSIKFTSKNRKNLPVDITCLICSHVFTVKWCRRNRKYCSNKCSHSCPTLRNHLSKKVNERIKNGTFIGWKDRKDKSPSYAEKYFIDLFNNENILNWEREYKVGMWFIDFAFIDKKIALEIDGKQHKLKERKESDDRKDEFLKNNGWNVFRIKWFNPSQKNKEKLYFQIEEFKKLLNG